MSATPTPELDPELSGASATPPPADVPPALPPAVPPVPEDALPPVLDPEEPAPQPEHEDAPFPTVAEFRALQTKVAELEAHVNELVGHLAQSFGDVYKQKKDRMGV